MKEPKNKKTLESTSLYGIWVVEKQRNYYPVDGGWWRDGNATVFATPYKEYAQAQCTALSYDMSPAFYTLTVVEIK